MCCLFYRFPSKLVVFNYISDSKSKTAVSTTTWEGQKLIYILSHSMPWCFLLILVYEIDFSVIWK